MFTEDDCPNLFCRDCLYYKGKADLDMVKSTCKRIDHKVVKFQIPWFEQYSCEDNHVICSDFKPMDINYNYMKGWTNFSDYWELYKKVWLPYGNENTTVGFTINGDTSIKYKVPLLYFVYYEMFDGNILRATYKTYVRRTQTSPTGYERVTERINGVSIDKNNMLNNMV